MDSYCYFLLVLLLATATLFTNVTLGAPVSERSPDVTIFVHENYKGRMVSYSLGSSCVNLMESFKDEVTSMKVNSGCVQLCQEYDCSKCTEVRKTYSNLADISLNDQIRSLKRCDDELLDNKV